LGAAEDWRIRVVHRYEHRIVPGTLRRWECKDRLVLVPRNVRLILLFGFASVFNFRVGLGR
jgi:hypothetical protein